ncbi:MAG: hypothetical protein JNJ85_01420 [Candidatus Kapabacteria bacterium]|nr:hypothetical protein [Candidatus Kapabacteria bacterium]
MSDYFLLSQVAPQLNGETTVVGALAKPQVSNKPTSWTWQIRQTITLYKY